MQDIKKQILGQAKHTTIVCKCVSCNNQYIMSCEDYVFNRTGIRYIDSDGYNAYCCPNCAEHILKVKNM